VSKNHNFLPSTSLTDDVAEDVRLCRADRQTYHRYTITADAVASSDAAYTVERRGRRPTLRGRRSKRCQLSCQVSVCRWADTLHASNAETASKAILVGVVARAGGVPRSSAACGALRTEVSAPRVARNADDNDVDADNVYRLCRKSRFRC